MMPYNSFELQSSYRKILSVQIKHSYFTSGFLKNFEFIPTEETKKILKNYALKETSINGGIIILGNRLERFNAVLFDNEINLDFFISIKDPNFYNYTDITYNLNKALLFRNQINDIYLHKGTFVDESCFIDNKWSGGVKGIVQLVINSENEYFGVNTKRENSNFKEYLINFQSRLTCKRFNIIGNVDDINNYYITDNENNKLNLRFEPRILANGSTAFSALFNSPERLKEKSNAFFYLKRDTTLSKYSKSFPFPDIQNLSFSHENDFYISDTFISL